MRNYRLPDDDEDTTVENDSTDADEPKPPIKH